jgi:deoxyxylulose-5-phosphate synthase
LRNTLLKNISQKLPTKRDIIVLLGDLGTFQMREASSLCPDRVINFGIMEQSMISFAAGLSKGGYYPITYSITPFLVDRAYEQIKIDLIYNNNNALILSAGASFDYSNLGPTHHCPHDVSNLLSINHPFIVHPFTKIESIQICDYLISHKQQAYFRISTSECELDNSKFKKINKLHIENTSEKQTLFEKYESVNKNRKNILSVLFGPDSKFLNNFEQIINKSGNLITVPIITQKSLKDLAFEVQNYDEIFFFIPYEPSSLISKLLNYLTSQNSFKPSFIKAIHPKNIFFDNSYKKESILKNFSEETQIM